MVFVVVVNFAIIVNGPSARASGQKYQGTQWWFRSNYAWMGVDGGQALESGG